MTSRRVIYLMVKTLVFLLVWNSINEIAIQECEGIVRQNKIMVSFSPSVNTCRFRLQETIQNMCLIGAYLREQIIVRFFTNRNLPRVRYGTSTSTYPVTWINILGPTLQCSVQIILITKIRKKLGSAEIWTRIAGFRVQSANRYTMEPLGYRYITFAIKCITIAVWHLRENVTYADISKSTFAGCCNTLAESHFKAEIDVTHLNKKQITQILVYINPIFISFYLFQ